MPWANGRPPVEGGFECLPTIGVPDRRENENLPIGGDVEGRFGIGPKQFQNRLFDNQRQADAMFHKGFDLSGLLCPLLQQCQYKGKTIERFRQGGKAGAFLTLLIDNANV